MTERAGGPDPSRRLKPPPRRVATVRVAIASFVATLALFGVLWWQMAAGNDPALGAGGSSPQTAAATGAGSQPAPAPTGAAPPATPPSASVPTAPAPVPSQPVAPVQTRTS
jgi:hypothetical protein